MNNAQKLAWHEKKIHDLKRLAAIDKKGDKLDAEETKLNQRIAEIVAERDELDEEEASINEGVEEEDELPKVMTYVGFSKIDD